MLEQIIENIIRKIRGEVVQKGMDQIPLTYLYTRNIPDSIKHFFDQEVELWIREEAEKFGSSDRFDYEMPEVRMLVDKIFDILKQTATFDLNRFNRLLERAIKLEANYLIRPHQTLTQFLFKDNYVITTIEVYDMLKYFDKFQYYKDALTNYFNIKYLREISQTQFEELIKGIDQQVFSKDPLETSMQTVKTINQFINEGREESSTVISARILSMCFRDRNLNDYADLVEIESKTGTDSFSLTEIELMLREGKPLSQIRAEEATSVEADINIDGIEEISEPAPSVDVAEIDVPEQIEAPVEEEVVDEFDDIDDEIEEEEDEEIEEVYEQEDARGQAADQLADIVGEKMKGDHLADLNQFISPKLRKKFVKKIFKKKENQYQEIINLLNNTPSWKNASNLIDTFFYQQGINPYSKEALEFSDLVYNRYYPKDISINKGEEFRY